MIVIDAKDIIVGRLGTVAAKKALLGETVAIINAEKAVISGKRNVTLSKYKVLDDKGEPFHGPFIPKRADFLLRRMLRGMVPWKTNRGREAYKRIKCYIGVPREFASAEKTVIKNASSEKLPNFHYTTIEDISFFLKAQ